MRLNLKPLIAWSSGTIWIGVTSESWIGFDCATAEEADKASMTPNSAADRKRDVILLNN
jgi:hypothetical protein